MRTLLPILCAACAWAQSAIEVPTAGAVVDPSGNLRQVQGVEGSFLLGPPAAAGVLAAACWERLCLAKTDSQILSPTGQTDAPPGPAVFGLGTADDAVVFFPATHSFARWRDNALEPVDWTVDGDLLSLRLRGEETEIAVRRDTGVWIVRPDGSTVDWIGTSTGPVLLLPEGVLFATSDQLILRRADASELRFDLADAESISALGPHYAAIRAGDAIYALRTDQGHENLWLLPGNTP
jgi:hypothetical protein